MILLSVHPKTKKEKEKNIVREKHCPLELEWHLWIKTNLAVKSVRIYTNLMDLVYVGLRKISEIHVCLYNS